MWVHLAESNWCCVPKGTQRTAVWTYSPENTLGVLLKTLRGLRGRSPHSGAAATEKLSDVEALVQTGARLDNSQKLHCRNQYSLACFLSFYLTDFSKRHLRGPESVEFFFIQYYFVIWSFKIYKVSEYLLSSLFFFPPVYSNSLKACYW